MTCKTDERSSQKWPAASAPQQLPCIKMALAWLPFSITLLWLSPMASNRLGLYRSKVGYHSRTSSQNLASKRAQYPPKMTKISINRPENHWKITFSNVKNPFSENKRDKPKIGHVPLVLWHFVWDHGLIKGCLSWARPLLECAPLVSWDIPGSWG